MDTACCKVRTLCHKLLHHKLDEWHSNSNPDVLVLGVCIFDITLVLTWEKWPNPSHLRIGHRSVLSHSHLDEWSLWLWGLGKVFSKENWTVSQRVHRAPSSSSVTPLMSSLRRTADRSKTTDANPPSTGSDAFRCPRIFWHVNLSLHRLLDFSHVSICDRYSTDRQRLGHRVLVCLVVYYWQV